MGSCWCDHYYRTGLRNGVIACIGCGRPQRVAICQQEELPAWVIGQEGMDYMIWPDGARLVSILCHACRDCCTTTLEGLCRVTSEGRQFYQEYGRIRTLPTQEVEAEGRRALVSRFESITDTAQLTVISDYETYEVLRIYQSG